MNSILQMRTVRLRNSKPPVQAVELGFKPVAICSGAQALNHLLELKCLRQWEFSDPLKRSSER